jgi:16S rRNA (adenine1518-N6/adenine1519-N6)-dimethyltransferase
MAARNRVNADAPSERKMGGRPPGRKARLGQNFLRDRGAAENIVQALGEIGHEVVVEIGAGPGILTEMLAARAGHLYAIELDRVLAAQLGLQFSRNSNVEVVEANILTVSLAGLLRQRTQPLAGVVPGQQVQRVQVIGNLPYYLTSDILLHLFAQYELIDRIVITVQKEVADRIAATPGGRDYGLLSATAQLHAKVEKLFTLPPGAFVPPPKVNSSVLRLTIGPRWQELGVERAPFTQFLKLSFSQKRKTLVNNLKQRYPEDRLRAALRSAGARSDARAEALSLEKMAKIFLAQQQLE